ncbi:enoyl-[acyl-carrier-protein] reductase FabI [Pseudooceanicola sediminis]|uniref:Enoyl-[acyl-carrier-protein] reductase [NADH] n=1 Tax=Pseudooceanicola sediminis TaxID=2211117 RepID=A0A399IZ33_9RHOB|nr:enoyl-ACP reductase FabI [Pseudooceanicola sediminis]KAA2313301.1 enoyl-ACP reductase FabI [Puniceibacterium sp. HSS470]RII38413.1 enoyl-[acyl-carrier-protein] reductase FabI [Pseudooceanicola sediminis]|tara:strand:+ start:4747 stop:5511 length:765 start_codon:yes stop_codon:yes gene_type:complete
MSELSGKVALVVGVANDHSIAAGCAQAFAAEGAEVALTYFNDRAKPHVQPVADAVGAALLLPLDVEAEGQMEAAFEAVRARWGRLDILVHSIAYCPAEDLHGRVTECSRAGFARAMDISVHSLIRMARLSEPLMTDGGAILTMTYYGGEKVVDHYNIMGPVKAALEGVMRSLAVELGPCQIRVNAISPGPLATRAGSGIAHFDELIDAARRRAPEQCLVTIEDVGNMAVMLASDRARRISGDIAYVDGGLHVRA